MCQGHGQHRCLALNPCHKQNTGRDLAVPSDVCAVLCSTWREGGRQAAHRTLADAIRCEAGRGRAKRGTASPHGAATLVADKVRAFLATFALEWARGGAGLGGEAHAVHPSRCRRPRNGGAAAHR